LNKISGTVTDEINLPLAFATVTIFNNNKLYQTQTDSNGNYCVANISEGIYYVYVNAKKFRRQSNIIILDSDFFDNSTYDFSLYPNRLVSRSVICYSSLRILEPINPLLRAPNPNINTIAAYMRGVDSRNGETPSIMGARPENTAYYLDGVRLAGMDQSLTIIGK
jgi:hypothetical protein